MAKKRINKGGRPKLDIDPAEVEKLAAIHCTIPEIASVLGCSKRTIINRFLHHVKKGRKNGRSSLRRKQWELADGGNVTMAIWLGKQLLGQRDKQDHEHTGRNGGPIKSTLNVDWSGFTTDEIIRFTRAFGGSIPGTETAGRN